MVGAVAAEPNCTACHMGNALNSGGTLSILNVPAVYKPDSTYIFTVELASTQTVGASGRKWGFQLTAVNGVTGAGFGTIARTNADTTTTQIINGSGAYSTRRYIEHNSTGTRTGQASPSTWTLRWTAPNAASSTVQARFFAAGNAANGSMTNSGDFIYTTSASSLPPARVSSSPVASFGTVIVGATAEVTYNINNSTAAPADTLDYTLSASAGFTAPGGTFSAAPASGNPHTLAMDASVAGSPAGTLVIDSNDPVTPSKNVALSGIVLEHSQPTLDSLAIAHSSTVDFGARDAGQFPDTTVRVFNLGWVSFEMAALHLTGATITGGDGRFTIPGGFTPQFVTSIIASIPVHFDDALATPDSTYEATLTFTCADQDLPGATARPDLVVTLRARVNPGNVAVERGGDDVPGADRLLPVRPNPVAGRAALQFDLARSGAVALDLYDLRGRRVRSFVREALEPGRYHYDWNGADDHGAPLPAGVYLLRYSAPGYRATQRVALVR